MKLPVLIYHDVAAANQMGAFEGNEKYYCLDLAAFRDQLDMLAQEGYRSMTSPGIVSTGGKPVMLTFDDGLASHYHCFKELHRRCLAGIFFVVTDFIGRPGYLTWQQINEMVRAGMSIQSHTCSHPIVTTISEEQLRHEFKDSRLALESELQVPVDAISIPRGFANSKVIDMAVDCGYRYIYTSEPGINQIDGERIVKRLTIFNRTTLSQFNRLIRMHPLEVAKQVYYKKVLSFPKAVLGANNYHRLRTALLKRFY